MHRYVIMGVQGSGKGTQARMLADEFHLDHVGTGDIFREQILQGSALGCKVQALVDSGQLVSDELVEEVVSERLKAPRAAGGFILDGFPRSRHQADFLLKRFAIDAVILIQLDDEEVIARVLARRLCNNCGRDYNLIYSPPQKPNLCDVCGGALTSRPDDTEDAIRERVAEYHAKTEPVVELLRQQVPVLVVAGSGSPEEIQREIRDGLRQLSPNAPRSAPA